jgi:hypothetical protein
MSSSPVSAAASSVGATGVNSCCRGTSYKAAGGQRQCCQHSSQFTYFHSLSFHGGFEPHVKTGGHHVLREEGNQCLNLPVTLFTFLDHIFITSYERTLIGGHLTKKSQETVTIRL